MKGLIVLWRMPVAQLSGGLLAGGPSWACCVLPACWPLMTATPGQGQTIVALQMWTRTVTSAKSGLPLLSTIPKLTTQSLGWATGRTAVSLTTASVPGALGQG